MAQGDGRGGADAGGALAPATEPPVLEPQVVALHIRCPRLFTMIEVDSWIMRHMLVPRTLREWETPSLSVADVSVDSPHLSWLPSDGTHPPHAPQQASAHAAAPSEYAYHPSTPWPSDQLFRITEKTVVLTFASRHRLVVLLDVSPSMAVVDVAGRPKVHLSTAFDTICKSFDGLVRPFEIPQPWKGSGLLIEPELLVTVIADAGNAHLPTTSADCDLSMRVLVQEISVTSRNLMSVAERLYDTMVAFENALRECGHRKPRDPIQLAQEALGKVPPIPDGVAPAGNALFGEAHPSTSPPSHLQSQTIQSPYQPPLSGPDHQARTRAMFSAFDAAFLALEQLPNDALPAILYLTDGVSPESDAEVSIPREVQRRIIGDAIRVTIVQVGSGSGFTPSVSFGHVPHTEFLRFVSDALSGVFIYSSDCPYMPDVPESSSIIEPQPFGPDHPLNPWTDHGGVPPPVTMAATSSINPSALGSASFTSPWPRPHSFVHVQHIPANFYHRMMMIREQILERRPFYGVSQRSVLGDIRNRPVDMPRCKLIDEGHTGPDDMEHTGLSPDESAFPWFLGSKPPVIAEILCEYRDYYIHQVRLADVIATRLREGFRVQSIHKSKRSSSRQSSRVEIILAMPWAQNFTIIYIVKMSWLPDPSMRMSFFDHGFAGTRLHIGLHVLGHHAFAMALMNIESIEKLEADGGGERVHDKLVQLRTLLRAIITTDETLRNLSSFNSRPALALCFPNIWAVKSLGFSSGASNIAPHEPERSSISSARSIAQPPPQQLDLPTNYWQQMAQIMQSWSLMLDEWRSPILLRSTSSRDQGAGAVEMALRGSDNKKRRQAAITWLDQLLSRWSSMSFDRPSSYIKLVFENPTGATPTGFCAAYLTPETDCIVMLSLYTFGVSLVARRALIDDLVAAIGNIQYAPKNGLPPLHPLTVCDKPVHRLLVRYTLRVPRGSRAARDGVADGAEPSYPGTSPRSPHTHTSESPLGHLSTSAATTGSSLGAGAREQSHRIEPLPVYSGSCSPFDSAFILQSPSSRSYMRLRRWIWFADIIEQPSHDGTHPMLVHRVQKRAFAQLYNTRLSDGFVPAAESPGCTTFYLQVPVKVTAHSDSPMRPCAVQFALLWNPDLQLLATELWVEPLSRVRRTEPHETRSDDETFADYYHDFVVGIETKDRALLSSIFAFEYIQELGRGVAIERVTLDESTKRLLSCAHDSHDNQVVPTPFHLPSVLRESPFSLAVFHVLSIDDGCDEDVVLKGVAASSTKASERSEYEQVQGASTRWCTPRSLWDDASHTGRLVPSAPFLEAIPVQRGESSATLTAQTIAAMREAEATAKHAAAVSVRHIAHATLPDTPLLAAGCPIPVSLVTGKDISQTARSNAVLHGFLTEALLRVSDLVVKWPVGLPVDQQSPSMHPTLDLDILEHIRSVLLGRYAHARAFLLRSVAQSVCHIKFVSSDRFIVAALHEYSVPMSEDPERDRINGHETHYFSIAFFDCARPSKPVKQPIVWVAPENSSRQDDTHARRHSLSPSAGGDEAEEFTDVEGDGNDDDQDAGGTDGDGPRPTLAGDNTNPTDRRRASRRDAASSKRFNAPETPRIPPSEPLTPVHIASLTCDEDGQFVRLAPGFVLAYGGEQHDSGVIGLGMRATVAGTNPDAATVASHSAIRMGRLSNGESPPSSSATPSVSASIPSISALLGPSAESQAFFDAVGEAYATAFAKTLFLSLIQGAPTTEKDVRRAFMAFEQTTLTVDLAPLLDSLAASAAFASASKATLGGASTPPLANSPSEAHLAESSWVPSPKISASKSPIDPAVDQVYQSILQKHFEPLSGRSKSEFASNFLFYRPTPVSSAATTPQGAVPAPWASTTAGVSEYKLPTRESPMINVDSPEALDLYRALVEIADTPLFVNVECVFRQGNCEIRVPAFDALPSQYPAELDRNRQRTAGSDAAGNPQNSSPANVFLDTHSMGDGASYASGASYTSADAASYASENNAGSSDLRTATLCINCWTLRMPRADAESTFEANASSSTAHVRRAPASDVTPSANTSPDQQTPVRESSTSTPAHRAGSALAGLERAHLSPDMRTSVENMRRNIENLSRERILRSMLSEEADGFSIPSGTLYAAQSLMRMRHAGSGIALPGLAGLSSPQSDSASAGASTTPESLRTTLERDSVHLRIPIMFLDPGVCLGFFRANISFFRSGGVDIHQIGDSFYLMDVVREGCAPRKYWAFIVPKLYELHLYLYGAFLSVDERVAIVLHVAKLARDCSERANRLKLLHDLKETQSASEYLIRPSQADIAEQAELGMTSSPAVTTSMDAINRERFAPGHFACPLVFEHPFQLHRRLSPALALDAVDSKLGGMAISNRKNFYITSAKSSVYYIQVVTSDASQTQSGPHSHQGSAYPSQHQSVATPLHPDRLLPSFKLVSASDRTRGADTGLLIPVGSFSSDAGASTLASASPGGGLASTTAASQRPGPTSSASHASGSAGSPSKTKPSSGHTLRLLVFGVDSPGTEITDEFVAMVHASLQKKTQDQLSESLARNFSIKLTREDVEFIMPVAKNTDPTRTVYYRLPIELENPHLFLLMLRQMLLSFLRPFSGGDVVATLLKHYKRFFRQLVEDQCVRGTVNEIHACDFAFLYNCFNTSRTPTQLEASVGSGLAAVCLTPISPDGKIMFPSRGAAGLQNTKHIDLDNFVPSVAESDTAAMVYMGYKVAVQIWCMGSLNVDALVARISRAFRTTAGDYAVESYFRSTNWIQLPPHELLREPLPSPTSHTDTPPEMVPTPSAGTGSSVLRGAASPEPDGERSAPASAGAASMSRAESATSSAGLTSDPPSPTMSVTPRADVSQRLARHPGPLAREASAESSASTASLSLPVDIAQFDKPLVILPQMLQLATTNENPVVQSFKVATELPLNTVASGMLDVLREEGLQLYLFSRNTLGGELRYVSSSLPHENLEIMLLLSMSGIPVLSPAHQIPGAAPQMESISASRMTQTKGMGEAQEYIIIAATSFVHRIDSALGSGAAHEGSDAAIVTAGASHTDRKVSVSSEISGSAPSLANARDRDRDRESISSFPRPRALNQAYAEETASETSTTSEALLSGSHRQGQHNHNHRSSRLLSELEELHMFGEPFAPAFPIYGKRSSFVVVTMATENVGVYSYNWKKTESERVFLKTLKLLNWCKIHYQFQKRKLRYMGLHLEHDCGRVTKFGEKRYSSAGGLVSSITASSTGSGIGSTADPSIEQELLFRPERKFRRLDFIYHIGSFDAINLQKQIVDCLEVFFRDGHGRGLHAIAGAPSHSKPASKVGLPHHPHAFTHSAGGPPAMAAVRARPIGIALPGGPGISGGATAHDPSKALSLTEMSRVLQSIELIHSASAPIFFSEHREDLMEKWTAILRAPRLDDPNVLRIANAKIVSSSHAVMEGQSLETVDWYKQMVADFLRDFADYLQLLGMEHVPWDLASSAEAGQHGGTFAVAPKFVIEAPSVFLMRCFSSGVIIVQCGFYTYFATVNVLKFAYQPDSRAIRNPKADFAAECENMKTQTHIVSFSFDFHLRYFQQKLEASATALPFDLVPVLRSFVILNPRKARFARNRILHGHFRHEMQDDSGTSLFKYILKNPQTYGFEPLTHAGITTACWLSTRDAAFPRILGVSASASAAAMSAAAAAAASAATAAGVEDTSDCEFTYTLILCAAKQDQRDWRLSGHSHTSTGYSEQHAEVSQDGQRPQHQSPLSPTTTFLEIEYFLLIVNNESRFPLIDVEKGALEQAIVDDPMREYISGGYYLHDIAKNTEKRIESLVSQATRYFGRDSLWSQLLAADRTTARETAEFRETQTEEWARVFIEKTTPNSRRVSAMDSRFHALVSDRRLPWLTIIEHLAHTNARHARFLLPASSTGPRHMYLINPANSDYMLHFEVGVPPGESRVAVDCLLVSREGIPDACEAAHLNDIVNSVLFFLWSGLGQL
ncbi:hypothetical protein HK105_205615 [Polyrhizophydium stewartii]|uniref:Uncharacterized protein n=1 Tax=Polyrhizophydium stewartii TaxID=2732419 RepID=A0ABR4N5Q7_9FUNG